MIWKLNVVLQKGDKVKVVSGDLKDVRGTVIEIKGDHAKIKP